MDARKKAAMQAEIQAVRDDYALKLLQARTSSEKARLGVELSVALNTVRAKYGVQWATG